MRHEVTEFAPWAEGVCEVCGALRLVTGPEDGPVCCFQCWRTEIPDPPAGSCLDELALCKEPSA